LLSNLRISKNTPHLSLVPQLCEAISHRTMVCEVSFAERESMVHKVARAELTAASKRIASNYHRK
jgi:hypothetical protein